MNEKNCNWFKLDTHSENNKQKTHIKPNEKTNDLSLQTYTLDFLMTSAFNFSNFPLSQRNVKHLYRWTKLVYEKKKLGKEIVVSFDNNKN